MSKTLASALRAVSTLEAEIQLVEKHYDACSEALATAPKEGEDGEKFL